MNYTSALQRWTIALCVLIAIPSLVQAQLTLDGELRPRTEYRNGYRALRTTDTEPWSSSGW